MMMWRTWSLYFVCIYACAALFLCHPSPSHSFIPCLKPSFSANTSHRNLPFCFSGLTSGLFNDTSEPIGFYFLVFPQFLLSFWFHLTLSIFAVCLFPVSKKRVVCARVVKMWFTVGVDVRIGVICPSGKSVTVDIGDELISYTLAICQVNVRKTFTNFA